MKKIACIAALAALALGFQGIVRAAETASPAAATSCEDKAVDKNGKKLAGAAKTSFVKKCEAEAKSACEDKALDKNGKKLAGAAKTSFVKKCEADAKGAK